MDIDTRLLRYFVAVADAGSVTRAAEELYVSQPALTKQIKQLETLLGAPLFTRSRAGMTLTEPGRALARLAPAVLAEWDLTQRETRRTASRCAHVMRVGFMASAANEATPRIVTEFSRRRPGWRTDMRQGAWSNPTAGLADADVDVALLRLPFPGQGDLRVAVLFTEPRWVALPTGHPLTARESIPFRELWDEPFVAALPETGRWRDHWLATEEREGHPVRVAAVADQPDDWLSAIANGYGIALAPESAARYYARPGVAYRPVRGVSPSQVGVVWDPVDDANPVVQDFVRCCLACVPPPHKGLPEPLISPVSGVRRGA